MADQKINALPVKTAPATGDKMLMIGAAEEYQIDYDQLATAILNKLTSKTYALDQGTKTLVAALNELNSKTDGLYCKHIVLGSGNQEIYLKIAKISWIKRVALIIGCNNISGVIHEVVAVHYDPSSGNVVAHTSGEKEWTVDQENATVSTTAIANSDLLVIHTGFTEIGCV